MFTLLATAALASAPAPAYVEFTPEMLTTFCKKNVGPLEEKFKEFGEGYAYSQYVKDETTEIFIGYLVRKNNVNPALKPQIVMICNYYAKGVADASEYALGLVKEHNRKLTK